MGLKQLLYQVCCKRPLKGSVGCKIHVYVLCKNSTTTVEKECYEVEVKTYRLICDVGLKQLLYQVCCKRPLKGSVGCKIHVYVLCKNSTTTVEKECYEVEVKTYRKLTINR